MKSVFWPIVQCVAAVWKPAPKLKEPRPKILGHTYVNVHVFRPSSHTLLHGKGFMNKKNLKRTQTRIGPSRPTLARQCCHCY